MKYISGTDLTPNQRSAVLIRFRLMWPDAQQWIEAHKFAVKTNGRLSDRNKKPIALDRDRA